MHVRVETVSSKSRYCSTFACGSKEATVKMPCEVTWISAKAELRAQHLCRLNKPALSHQEEVRFTTTRNRLVRSWPASKPFPFPYPGRLLRAKLPGKRQETPLVQRGPVLLIPRRHALRLQHASRSRLQTADRNGSGDKCFA